MFHPAIRLLGVVLPVALLGAQPAPDSWRLAHPDAALLLGADVRAILTSPAGKSLGASFASPGLGMLGGPAFQFLRDIDSILISVPAPKTGAARVPAPGPNANSPMLIVLTGSFPAAHLSAIRQGAHAPYVGVEIYSSPGTPATSPRLAVLDEHTILVGDLPSLHGAIDRAKGRTPAATPLLARASELARANHVWFVASALQNLLPPMPSQPGGAALSALASQLRGVEGGINFRDGMDLAFTLNTKDAASASGMAKLFTERMHAVPQGQPGATQAAEFLRKVNVTAEGSNVHMKFSMTKEEMATAAMMAQLMGAQGMKAATQKTSEPTVAQPSRDDGGIKVYGMPGGVAEFPAESSKPQ
jgi:hypothetical protein